jgi:hypothetical protein
MGLQQTLANPLAINPNRNITNENCCSQSVYFRRLAVFRQADASLVCSHKT